MMNGVSPEDSNQPPRRMDLARSQLLDQLFSDLPESFEARFALLREMKLAMNQRIVESMEPVFNLHLQSMRSDELSEKQEIAEWVDQTTRALGLVVAARDTGEPALLVGADYLHGHDASHFVMLVPDKRGRDPRRCHVALHHQPIRLLPLDPEKAGILDNLRHNAYRNGEWSR